MTPPKSTNMLLQGPIRAHRVTRLRFYGYCSFNLGVFNANPKQLSCKIWSRSFLIFGFFSSIHMLFWSKRETLPITLQCEAGHSPSSPNTKRPFRYLAPNRNLPNLRCRPSALLGMALSQSLDPSLTTQFSLARSRTEVVS